VKDAVWGRSSSRQRRWYTFIGVPSTQPGTSSFCVMFTSARITFVLGEEASSTRTATASSISRTSHDQLAPGIGVR
jgi:hypothetical protein